MQIKSNLGPKLYASCVGILTPFKRVKNTAEKNQIFEVCELDNVENMLVVVSF